MDMYKNPRSSIEKQNWVLLLSNRQGVEGLCLCHGAGPVALTDGRRTRNLHLEVLLCLGLQ